MLKKVLDFYTKYFAVWVIVPLFVGFGVRHYFKEKIEKVLPIFPAISVTFIIFICIITAFVMAELWRKSRAKHERQQNKYYILSGRILHSADIEAIIRVQFWH